MKPFFTYFGGKYRAAPTYPTPEHQTIIEPFAGSAGYSLRYPERNVILVDLDPVVIGTWDYLIKTPSSEILRLPLYDGSWETTDDLTHLPQEARWLIGWWLNKGTTAPGKRPSAWMREGIRPKSSWSPEIRNRIASQVEDIRHWTAIHSSYADIPNREATWFIDPPYEVRGHRYTQSKVDFRHLALWSVQREGQTIVCENDGAKWLPFLPHREIKATSGHGRAGTSKEVIWTNEGSLL